MTEARYRRPLLLCVLERDAELRSSAFRVESLCTRVLVTSWLRASCGRNFDKYFMKNVAVFTTTLEALCVMQLFQAVMR